ncbi:MAG: ferrous iron transport protein A [Cyanobacteria bacterium P01_H01_bin.74]
MPSNLYSPGQIISLDQAKTGSNFRITEINNADTAAMTVRLGILVGQTVAISAKIPGGPVVISLNNLEIALGREYCKDIRGEIFHP